MPLVTRFAPSPTGRLHLGHAFSAWVGWRFARAGGGRWLVRIEDIDPGRCRAAFVEGIMEDLRWLGLEPDGAVVRQSERLPDYAEALSRLRGAGVLYPCFCTRAEIAAEVARSAAAPHEGEGGPPYPGTCRRLGAAERARRIAAEPHAWRLDVGGALARAGPLVWQDLLAGSLPARPGAAGDLVLARKDAPVSYHLAVTIDDAAQGVSLVTRGADLFQATHVHRLIQALLGLPVPRWLHHPLLADSAGERLAKRRGSQSLADLRARGADASALVRQFHELAERWTLPMSRLLEQEGPA